MIRDIGKDAKGSKSAQTPLPRTRDLPPQASTAGRIALYPAGPRDEILEVLLVRRLRMPHEHTQIGAGFASRSAENGKNRNRSSRRVRTFQLNLSGRGASSQCVRGTAELQGHHTRQHTTATIFLAMLRWATRGEQCEDQALVVVHSVPHSKGRRDTLGNRRRPKGWRRRKRERERTRSNGLARDFGGGVFG